AAGRALNLELKTFEQLAAATVAAGEPSKVADEALASIDVAAAIAVLAMECRYVRPAIHRSTEFMIAGGSHPVVEQMRGEQLAATTAAAGEPIKAAAEAMARIDVAAALAMLAVECRYVRPAIDGSTDFMIVGGRHPVVEQMRDAPFVANDCDLSPLSGEQA